MVGNGARGTEHGQRSERESLRCVDAAFRPVGWRRVLFGTAKSTSCRLVMAAVPECSAGLERQMAWEDGVTDVNTLKSVPNDRVERKVAEYAAPGYMIEKTCPPSDGKRTVRATEAQQVEMAATAAVLTNSGLAKAEMQPPEPSGATFVLWSGRRHSAGWHASMSSILKEPLSARKSIRSPAGIHAPRSRLRQQPCVRGL